MIRLLHVFAIAVLLSSAAYAYTIKYEALFHSEQLAKLKSRAQKERETIAVLKAEWQLLNRPERLQAVVDRHLELPPLQVQQLARFSDIPEKNDKVDEIAKKLELLGLMQSTATPKDKKPSDPRTTGSTTPGR